MSDIKINLPGFVKNFNYKPYDEKMYYSILGFYNNKEVNLCITERKKNPSSNTHGYYRGIILPICQQTELFRGWRLDEIHKYFASKYLKDVVEKEINGMNVIIVTTLSSGEVSQKTMNKFIDEVVKELNENGIVVPEAIKQ